MLDLHRPAIVVLCLGGNDVYSSRESVLTIGMRLYDYAQSLVARGVSHVVVCQIVRRQCVRRYSWEEGTQQVLEVNEFLNAVSTLNVYLFGITADFGSRSVNIFGGKVFISMISETIHFGVVLRVLFLKRLGLGR